MLNKSAASIDIGVPSGISPGQNQPQSRPRLDGRNPPVAA
jgi:hypothetical protein